MFCDTGYPAEKLEIFIFVAVRAFRKNRLGRCISLAKQPYTVNIENVPLKLKVFVFNVIYLYISSLSVSLPSFVSPLLHTWAYFVFLDLFKKIQKH